jgi:hypothetical protein
VHRKDRDSTVHHPKHHLFCDVCINALETQAHTRSKVACDLAVAVQDSLLETAPRMIRWQQI